ncbi:YdeI/OmpD-associated family protein [Cohnella abietis]|uniref:Bacteriocin-protection protein n=1 Tax=Cohnella abietis TaxID=2507935 RepID=A0A3T1D852_9BACL|nr:YdeI/OmpD-associated family protein [Cohnella abietis]BBI34262.1 hypothetical protein KCTCHS21_36610 [Cohnella abietis]
MDDQVLYFPSPAEWRIWLNDNHEQVSHLLVLFYKKGSGKLSMTWPESVDEALCYGWIDGVRKGRDEESYTIRFTPRKANSIWSAVNIARVEHLTEQGLMRPAGLAAFGRRKLEKSAIYMHEQKDENVVLDPKYEQQLMANQKAWDFFQNQSPRYRKSAIWWINGAKREETRLKRLATLIQDSEAGKLLAMFTWSKSAN